MKFNKDCLRLYAITDRSWIERKPLIEQIEDALKGGATIIQLREKNLNVAEFIEEAKKVKELCHRYNVPLIINDNLLVALESRADGIHVGIEDLPVSEIRKKTSADFIIGATAKTVEQAQKAEREGADYIGVGAVFPSPTKQNAIRIDSFQFDKISSSVSIPKVAIGGITYDNLDQLSSFKMDGVAVVSAVFGESDITQATKKLKEKINAILIDS